MKLKDGEIICPECKGTGRESESTISAAGYEMTFECKKCQGDGKFDWVERVMGKTPRPFDMETIYATMAKQIADDIEILSKIIEESKVEEKKEKKEELNDHGVFSEFMLRTTNQQILKGETD